MKASGCGVELRTRRHAAVVRRVAVRAVTARGLRQWNICADSARTNRPDPIAHVVGRLMSATTGSEPDRIDRFLCISVDVQGYGGHDDVRQGEIQRDLVALLDEAGRRSGSRRSRWIRQPKGDEE